MSCLKENSRVLSCLLGLVIGFWVYDFGALGLSKSFARLTSPVDAPWHFLWFHVRNADKQKSPPIP